MLDWLNGHGVDEVILSCGFMSDEVRQVLGDIYNGMRLRYVVEEEPLGTGGPVRLAFDQGVLDERLLVLNGDVLSDMDLTAELEMHERTGARVTLALHPVEDTESYGVVPLAGGRPGRGLPREDRGAADQPRQRGRLRARARRGRRADPRGTGRLVRARGVSHARRRRLSTVRGRPATGSTSGRPSATSRRPGTCSPGRVASQLPPRDETGSLVYENCLLSGAHIGPQSVLGRHCSVGTDARVERSVLHERVHVGADAAIIEAVLAERVRVGERARVEPGAMVGAGAVIGQDAVIGAGARIDPGMTVQAAERVS